MEDETLQSIRYSTFGQTASALNLRGTARNYEGIALQSIVFSQDQRVKDFVFSELNADAAGRVGFNLKLDLDPSLFNYADHLLTASP